MADEEIISNKISWNLFESKSWKPTDEPTDLVIKDWVMKEFDYNGQKILGIFVIIIVENGREVNKEWKITSKRLISSLKPLIEKAESEGKKTVALRVFKTGQALQTKFIVKAN